MVLGFLVGHLADQFRFHVPHVPQFPTGWLGEENAHLGVLTVETVEDVQHEWSRLLIVVHVFPPVQIGVSRRVTTRRLRVSRCYDRSGGWFVAVTQINSREYRGGGEFPLPTGRSRVVRLPERYVTEFLTGQVTTPGVQDDGFLLTHRTTLVKPLDGISQG